MIKFKLRKTWAVPLAALVLVLLLVAGQFGRHAKTAGARPGYDYNALARAVVMDGGRAKPLDSVARNALLMLYHKQRFVHQGKTMDALPWLMDVIARPTQAADYQVFRVDHADVIQLSGKRPSDGRDGKYFSYNQLKPGIAAVRQHALRLAEQEKNAGSQRDANGQAIKPVLTVYDQAIKELADKLALYEQLARGVRPLAIPPTPEFEEMPWLAHGDSSVLTAAMAQQDPHGIIRLVQVFYDVMQTVEHEGLRTPIEITGFFEARDKQNPLAMQYLQASALYSAYLVGDKKVWDQAVEKALAGQPSPEVGRAIYQQHYRVIEKLSTDLSVWNLLATTKLVLRERFDGHWQEMVEAYRAQDPEAFNAALAKRQDFLESQGVSAVSKAGAEVWLHNRLMPFAQAQALDVLGFVLAMVVLCFGRSEAGSWGRAFWRAMMVALCAGFVVHSFGLLVRMYLHGRPPVTDLYSSAVLVGWAAVGLCLIIEWFNKRGFAGIVASVCGFVTLLIAHHLHLEKGGDTIAPMIAVLDSNFWLATHVVLIVLGYSATFVAGLLGIVYIVVGLVTPGLDRPAARQLTQMVYGTVCFALLLSFVGTVLGGIWADQSWGRFLGWDPKENGAVMVVMMNALILHAKWGRLVRERGIMVLAVGGNIITVWSWFGTNQLSVGLHAYGFTDGTVWWLRLVAGVHLLIMGVALLVPTRYWRSFRSARPARSVQA